jgi:hypothetical protein
VRNAPLPLNISESMLGHSQWDYTSERTDIVEMCRNWHAQSFGEYPTIVKRIRKFYSSTINALHTALGRRKNVASFILESMMSTWERMAKHITEFQLVCTWEPI